MPQDAPTSESSLFSWGSPMNKMFPPPFEVFFFKNKKNNIQEWPFSDIFRNIFNRITVKIEVVLEWKIFQCACGHQDLCPDEVVWVFWKHYLSRWVEFTLRTWALYIVSSCLVRNTISRPSSGCMLATYKGCRLGLASSKLFDTWL